MSCPEKIALIEAYADGELDLGASLEIEQHLTGCRVCTTALENHKALRSAFSKAGPYYEAPPRLRSHVRSSLRKEAKVSEPVGRPLFWSWIAVASPAVSVVILTVALVVLAKKPSPGDLLNQELVSAHVRSLMGNHLADFPSTDRHTVKPSFSGHIDFSPEVADLSSAGFTLVGGRLDYLESRPAAALVYERRKHVINLFIRPSETGGDASVKEMSLRGYNLIRWARSGMDYAAVSDLNAAELREFRQALHP